jgi:hypothetical protein
VIRRATVGSRRNAPAVPGRFRRLLVATTHAIDGGITAGGVYRTGARAGAGAMVRNRCVVMVAAMIGVTLPAMPAAAYDFLLSVRTVGQGYQERRYGPSGAAQMLSRRRLTQYLSLSVFNIAPEQWRGRDGDRNSVSFELGMRFDSDFGQFLLGRPRGMDAIGELAQNQIDILYAYLLAKDVGGHFDLQVGRQLHYDLVDFYSFDGGDAQVRVGSHATAQAFAGTEVRGELPLSAPLYEIDGTSSGSRDPATRPEQSRALRPMVGGALALDRASPVDARIAYRRVFSATVDPIAGDPSSGVNHESLSITADTRVWRDQLFVVGGARYNLLVAGWDDIQLAVRWRPTPDHLLSAEYRYLAPTFDGDSIWNIFGADAYSDWRITHDVQISARWRAHVRGFLRRFAALAQRSNADRDEREATLAYGGHVGVDERGTRARVRVDTYAEAGQGGWKVGGDLSGRFGVLPNVLDIEGRLTTYVWRADGVPDPRAALMLGTGAGALYQMSRKMRLHFLGENNAGTYYRAQVRGLAVLEVDVTL